MSRGQSSKHSLRNLRGLPDDTMRDEVYRWGMTLPVNFTGVIVKGTADEVFPSGGNHLLAWDTVLYETDKFFGAPASPGYFIIPQELGGIYNYVCNFRNSSIAAFANGEVGLEHTDGYTGLVRVCARHWFGSLPVGSSVNLNLTIPRVLVPGDRIRPFMTQNSGAPITITALAESSTNVNSIVQMFHRLYPATPNVL